MMRAALVLLSVLITNAADLPFLSPMSPLPRIGTQKFGLVMAYYSEFTADSTTQALLTAHFKSQPESYMDWASFSKMDLEVEIFFYPLGITERDAGACRGHPGFLFDNVPGFDSASYDVKAFYAVTTTGCASGCSSGTGGIKCSLAYNYFDHACDPTSTTTLCQRTLMHELLHALGLKYHANMYECTASEIANFPETTWRDCTPVEYGGRLDALGSVNVYGKISWGVAAKLRYDLHWLNGSDIIVLEKTDAPSSWTETSIDVALTALDTADGNAAVVRFTDPELSSLGLIWLEYRGGYSFDSNVASANPGIFAFHYGVILIDLNNTGAANVDPHVSLDVGADVWTDAASGLQLETISVDGTQAIVRVTFSQPPTCVAAAPTLNLPGYYGGYKVYLAKAGDNSVGALAPYQPTDSSWGAVSIRDWIGEYMPYWYTTEYDSYPLIFSYLTSARNNDDATCGASTLSVRGRVLPSGWRVDEGACQNSAGGQSTTDVCFSVAVASGTADGAYEILIEIFKEEDGMVSPTPYRLWICVGGFNPWFQSVTNDRYPAWECTYGNATTVLKPVPVTLEPTSVPMPNPTHIPTPLPTAQPTPVPSPLPTTQPTQLPTSAPTLGDTVRVAISFCGSGAAPPTDSEAAAMRSTIAGTLGVSESDINDFFISNTGCAVAQRRALLEIDWHIYFTLKQATSTSALGSSKEEIANSAQAALSDPVFEAQVLLVVGIAFDVDTESFVVEDATRELDDDSKATKGDSSMALIVVAVLVWALAVGAALKSYLAPRPKESTSAPPVLPTTNATRQVSTSSNGTKFKGPWVEMAKSRLAPVESAGAGEASI